MKYTIVTPHSNMLLDTPGLWYNERQLFKLLTDGLEVEGLDLLVAEIGSYQEIDRCVIEVHTGVRWFQRGIVVSYGNPQSQLLAGAIAAGLGSQQLPVKVFVKPAVRFSLCHKHLRSSVGDQRIGLDLHGVFDRSTKVWLKTVEGIAALRRGLIQGMEWHTTVVALYDGRH